MKSWNEIVAVGGSEINPEAAAYDGDDDLLVIGEGFIQKHGYIYVAILW